VLRRAESTSPEAYATAVRELAEQARSSGQIDELIEAARDSGTLDKLVRHGNLTPAETRIAALAPPAPGRVQSRINLRAGDREAVMVHVLDLHRAANLKKGKSQLSLSGRELRGLLLSRATVDLELAFSESADFAYRTIYSLFSSRPYLFLRGICLCAGTG